MALAPTSIGYQDLAAFLMQRPGVAESSREHLIASPFGTIEPATFSFARPIGTAMPQPYSLQPVSFDPRSLDVKTWSFAPPLMRPAIAIVYPSVNRKLKGDRLPLPAPAPAAPPPLLPQLRPISAPNATPVPLDRPPPLMTPRPKDVDATPVPDAAFAAIKPIEAAPIPVAAAATAAADFADDDIASSLAEDSEPLEPAVPAFGSPSYFEGDAAERDAKLYFGVTTMGARKGLQQWSPGAEPVLVSAPDDADIKLASLGGAEAIAGAADAGGESVASKDNVNRLRSPADRLALSGRPRARAEKCLADAIYFEARGETFRGQEAVAQVVMNRVFSGYYPHDVCGVVFQNANRHLACQFTFACEGKDLSRIEEPDMWAQAKRIAKAALDGKIWLPEVGHATHYHAYWVHPSWVHEMARLYKLGVHTFYRPRAWGDGSDAPIWAAGEAKSGKIDSNGKADGAAKADAAKSPQASAAPVSAAHERAAKL